MWASQRPGPRAWTIPFLKRRYDLFSEPVTRRPLLRQFPSPQSLAWPTRRSYPKQLAPEFRVSSRFGMSSPLNRLSKRASRSPATLPWIGPASVRPEVEPPIRANQSMVYRRVAVISGYHARTWENGIWNGRAGADDQGPQNNTAISVQKVGANAIMRWPAVALGKAFTGDGHRRILTTMTLRLVFSEDYVCLASRARPR